MLEFRKSISFPIPLLFTLHDDFYSIAVNQICSHMSWTYIINSDFVEEPLMRSVGPLPSSAICVKHKNHRPLGTLISGKQIKIVFCLWNILRLRRGVIYHHQINDSSAVLSDLCLTQKPQTAGDMKHRETALDPPSVNQPRSLWRSYLPSGDEWLFRRPQHRIHKLEYLLQ